MLKLYSLLMMACLAAVLAERHKPRRGLIHHIPRNVAGPNPYIFLTVPKGRSEALLQGFEVIEENVIRQSPNEQDFDSREEADNDSEEMTEESSDDTDAVADADADEDDIQQVENDDNEEAINSLKNLVVEEDEDEITNDDSGDEFDDIMSFNLKLRKSNPQFENAKVTQMLVSREHAGAIMVPDEIFEIESQSVIDGNNGGKSAILLPRSVLDSIPDGSVLAFMERSGHDEAEERANRVIVRRRRKGARRNIKRQKGSNQNLANNKRGSNKRRVCNCKLTNVRPKNRRDNKKHRGNDQGD